MFKENNLAPINNFTRDFKEISEMFGEKQIH